MLRRALLALPLLVLGTAGCIPGGGSPPPSSDLEIEIAWDGFTECIPNGEPTVIWPRCWDDATVTVTNHGPDATFGPVVLKAVGGQSTAGDQTFAFLTGSTCGVPLAPDESCQARLHAEAFHTELNGVVGTVFALSAHATASEDFTRTTG